MRTSIKVWSPINILNILQYEKLHKLGVG